MEEVSDRGRGCKKRSRIREESRVRFFLISYPRERRDNRGESVDGKCGMKCEKGE